jgi:hypothetical protein
MAYFPEKGPAHYLKSITGLGPAQYIFWAISFLIAYSDYAELTLIAIIIPYVRCEWNLSKEFEATITISIFLIYAASKFSDFVTQTVSL